MTAHGNGEQISAGVKLGWAEREAHVAIKGNTGRDPCDYPNLVYLAFGGGDTELCVC